MVVKNSWSRRRRKCGLRFARPPIGVAMRRLTATWRCRVRAAPRLRRASRPRHRQPCGHHRPAGHECRLRGTRMLTNGITESIARLLSWDMMPSLHGVLSIHIKLSNIRVAPQGRIRVPRMRNSCLGGRRKPEGLPAARHIPRRTLRPVGES